MAFRTKTTIPKYRSKKERQKQTDNLTSGMHGISGSLSKEIRPEVVKFVYYL